MTYVAGLIETVPPTGYVVSPDNIRVAVVASRSNDDGRWHPAYGVKRYSDGTTERLALPPCFTLDPLAAEALEEAYNMEATS